VRHLRLVVTWEPSASQVLTLVRHGHYDQALRRLAHQLGGLSPAPVFRPMPEMNANWSSWAPVAAGRPAGDFIRAWRHVRSVVRAGGGRRLRFLWAPYARSVPDTDPNQMGAYWPGADQVDLVGASGYNFGTTGDLTWTTPDGIFGDAYATIEDLGAKPFWIAETASTSAGGDKAAWIRQLAAERSAMPELRGILWYQVVDQDGDWRATETPATTTAFAGLVRRACR
jgi:beta-mannanase